MNDFTIRQAEIGDLGVIQRLNAELFEYDYPRDDLLDLEWSLSEPGEQYFLHRIEGAGNEAFCMIAESQGDPIGYMAGSILHPEPDSMRPVNIAKLENVFVLEDWRGMGVGTELFEMFEDWARGQSAERLKVSAYASNEIALGFYKSRGFADYSVTLEKEL